MNTFSILAVATLLAAAPGEPDDAALDAEAIQQPPLFATVVVHFLDTGERFLHGTILKGQPLFFSLSLGNRAVREASQAHELDKRNERRTAAREQRVAVLQPFEPDQSVAVSVPQDGGGWQSFVSFRIYAIVEVDRFAGLTQDVEWIGPSAIRAGMTHKELFRRPSDPIHKMGANAAVELPPWHSDGLDQGTYFIEATYDSTSSLDPDAWKGRVVARSESFEVRRTKSLSEHQAVLKSATSFHLRRSEFAAARAAAGRLIESMSPLPGMLGHHFVGESLHREGRTEEALLYWERLAARFKASGDALLSVSAGCKAETYRRQLPGDRPPVWDCPRSSHRMPCGNRSRPSGR